MTGPDADLACQKGNDIQLALRHNNWVVIREAARVAGEFATKLFHADSGSIYIAEPGQAKFRILGSWGLQNETAETLQLNDCWGLRQNQAYPHNENQIGIRCHHLSIGPNRHSCCMPMFANGQATGLICLRSNLPSAADLGLRAAEAEAGRRGLPR